MAESQRRLKFKWPRGLTCLLVVIGVFAYFGVVMGVPNMLNTIMHTAHDLLLNTVFFLMAMCVLSGAMGKLLVEFGVVDLIERLIRPLMKPFFNLPGVAALGAVLTFLSDNPAIITLAKDKKFAVYFKKYQYISLTNFGTSFGMGLIVTVFMMGQGFYIEPLIGIVGAFCGGIAATRLMQHFILKEYPQYEFEDAVETSTEKAQEEENTPKQSIFIRFLNSILDGGMTGVYTGLAIIPGVLIISTFVMVLTSGPSASGTYTGAAYEGTALLPLLAGKVNFLFDWLFGLEDPHLAAFPITALGSVGAALGLVPSFLEQGWANGNAIAVFTAIGMCWSGYLSTHTALLDSLGYRQLISKDLIAQAIGGLVAAFVAHWLYFLVTLL